MKLRYLFTVFFVLNFVIICAQDKNTEVLFTVDDEPVFTSEFIRVYNKNLDLVQDESQKDVDEYLTLFTNYKLKLKEAKALGLHEKMSYKRELRNYRKQLAQSYITDTKITDALVKEAYERTLNEIKANHILIKVDANAKPQDTLLAYNKILELRNKALKEGFDTIRKAVHNGQTVFGEELGFFSGFKMVYKFENAAYNTPVGEISLPFRTQFGYHIVNVQERRVSRGERTVAHIMVAKNKKGASAEESKSRIFDIYNKLKQGEDFEALAKQFSDDKSSAPKGGMLSPFAGGQLSSQEFENVAFGLKNIGDISSPFKSKFGWHIIKLYDKKLIPSFENMKAELEQKIKRDSRSKLIDDALIKKLKIQYKVEGNPKALQFFVSILNENYFKRAWKLPSNLELENKRLLKIDQKQITYKDFANYLLKTQRKFQPKMSLERLVAKKYEEFIKNRLLEYKEANLENENIEFAHIVSEYRDGLLLFDLMENTIWNATKTDSIAIKEYYNTNKEKYISPKRVSAIVASSTKQKTLKKVSKLLEQGSNIGDIKNLLNKNGKVQVIFTSDTMDAEHQALPEGFQFKKGISKIYKHNDAFVVVQVKDILPETQRTFEEAKGIVVSDYQTYKEKKWLSALSNKYRVVINEGALNKIKAKLKE